MCTYSVYIYQFFFFFFYVHTHGYLFSGYVINSVQNYDSYIVRMNVRTSPKSK